MYGSVDSAKRWTKTFISANHASNNTIIVCPPNPLITTLKESLKASNIHLGGQDCHVQEEGAYTGETSAVLLKDVGCEYVIVGHSERRLNASEINEIVCKKAARAIISELIPIICIGETSEQRASGRTLEVIHQQIEESIPTEVAAGNFIIAYEPVWAIGSGNLPTTQEISYVHSAIIRAISKRLAIDIADISVLYGGSVKSDNVKEILALPEVSGVLVGGASLKADEFLKIAASV
jgi:triosephosphate isomerase (TIM)